jgi:hypothetical protein
LLKEHILNNKDLKILDTKRLFIKWARREGEEWKLRIESTMKNKIKQNLS